MSTPGPAHIVDHSASHIAATLRCGRLQVGEYLVIHHNIYLRVDVRLRPLQLRLSRPSQRGAAVGRQSLNAAHAGDADADAKWSAAHQWGGQLAIAELSLQREREKAREVSEKLREREGRRRDLETDRERDRERDKERESDI